MSFRATARRGASIVALLLVTSFAGVARAQLGTDEPPSEQKDAARAEVQAANAAFAADDLDQALAHYEAAMALLPAPKLHYNIAVCHQRLAMRAETPEQRTRHRDLAIESYNAYLEQNPRADDRLEIAETIRELGGVPVTMPSLKPLFEDEPGPDADADPADADPADADPADADPADADPADADPADADQPPPELEQGRPQEPVPDRSMPGPAPTSNHGRFGVMLLGGFSPTLSGAAAVDAAGLVALDLHGGGFLGPRRRFLLAAHTAVFAGVDLPGGGLPLSGYSVGLLGQQTWVVGREAAQIGIGSVVALASQSIREGAMAPGPSCRNVRGASQIASRSGASFAPRLDVGVLLGPWRRAMINLVVQPSMVVFGDGASSVDCDPGDTPWTALDIRKRWQFQLWAGAGFSFRF